MYSILLVDDDADVRKLVKKILEKSGYSVVAVDNGLSALSEINNNHYDLLLSDANMPQYSGFDLLKAVRRLPKHKDLAIAMLTGRREMDAIQKAVELGANDYIVKPVDPDVLVTKIQKLIGNKFVQIEAPPPENVEVNLEASFQSPLKVKKLSPDGFSATCASPFNIGQDFYLNIDDLNYDVLPKVRIVSSIVDPINSKLYLIHGVFLESDASFKKAIEAITNKSQFKAS